MKGTIVAKTVLWKFHSAFFLEGLAVAHVVGAKLLGPLANIIEPHVLVHAS